MYINNIHVNRYMLNISHRYILSFLYPMLYGTIIKLNRHFQPLFRTDSCTIIIIRDVNGEKM